MEGQLRIRNTQQNAYGIVTSCDAVVGDISVRVLARMEVPAGLREPGVDVFAHCAAEPSPGRGYALACLSSGTLRLLRLDPGLRVDLAPPAAGIALTDELAFLQLDVRGDMVEGRAWRQDEPMPVYPTIAARDTTYRSGQVGVGGLSSPPHADSQSWHRELSLPASASPTTAKSMNMPASNTRVVMSFRIVVLLE